jgi:parvulin-like peptidyl-prolyl isomerase
MALRDVPPMLIAVGMMAALLLAGCSKPPPPLPAVTKDGSPVVAMVGTEPITMASLQVIAAQNGYNLLNDKERELALRDAVNNEILAAKAKELGYENDPDIRRYVKSQAVQKLLLASVDSKQQSNLAVPTEAELKAYYDNNLAEFTPPTIAQAQVLAVLKRKGQERVYDQKIAAVTQAIAAKQIPFGELVKQYSDDPAAQTYGGMTPWLVKGGENKQYPQSLLEALFKAEANGVVGPIKHNDWTYFAKLHERRDSTAAGFDQAKAGIAQAMMRQKRLATYNRLVEALKSNVPVQSFPEKVTEALKAATQQGGPPMGPVQSTK